MGGADIPAKAERLLGAVRGFANYFLLVFDNEGTARALIDELVRGKVIEGVSDQQRAATIRQAAEAAKQIDDPEVRLNALRNAREHASHLDEEPGAAPEFLLWRENFEADNFTPREMFDVLLTYAREEAAIEDLRLSLEEVEERLADEGEEMAIASLLLAEHLVQLTWADRRLSGELRRR